MSNQNHSHNHHHHGDMKGTKLGISILLNLAITIAQAIGGVLSGSLSLLADALHNFTDVIALVISYVANRLSKREYSKDKTFGYKRAEIIAAFVNATTLIVVAVWLAIESVFRFGNTNEIESMYVIVLAIASILVNGGSVLLLHSETENNMNMRSAYLHLLTDMFTSFGVLASGLAMYFFNMYWLDSVLSILISVYLLYMASGLLKQTLHVLMQFAPEHIDIDTIKADVETIKHVDNLHHLHVWLLNDTDIHFDAHIEIDHDMPLSEASKITEEIKTLLKNKYGIVHSYIQIEFDPDDSHQLIIDER